MVSSRYMKIKKVLEDWINLNGSTITLPQLRKLIIINIGGDEKRTVIPYLKLIDELELIKKQEIGEDYVIRGL